MPLFFLLFHTCVGNTPLHSACECLNTNLIAVLSLMLALGPNAAMEKDRDGNLALHSAAESKNSRQTTLFSATMPNDVMGIARFALRTKFEYVDCVGKDDQGTHQRVPQFVTVYNPNIWIHDYLG